MKSLPTCAICNHSSSQILEYTVRGSHKAALWECDNCGFLFVYNPTWLHDSFSDQLNDLDIGALDRSIVLSEYIDVLLLSLRKRNGKFLDWGGGYGVLTRLMRERGFNFVNYDPYVKPLFSNPANTDRLDQYDLISMGEVALHLTDPLKTFHDLLSHTDTVLFTAVIAPDVLPFDWWYLMPDTGQHVTIFREASILELAKQLGVQVTSDGRYFHLLHRRKISLLTKLLIRFRPLIFLLAWWRYTIRNLKRGVGREHSLTHFDQMELMSKLPWKTKK